MKGYAELVQRVDVAVSLQLLCHDESLVGVYRRVRGFDPNEGICETP